MLLFDHAGGKHHGCERHGNVVGQLREHLLHQIAPGGAAGGDHEFVFFGHLFQKVLRLFHHAQIRADGHLVHVLETQALEGSLHFAGNGVGAELTHKGRCQRHIDRRAALDGHDGLEDLALVGDGAEGAGHQALAAGGAAFIVDGGPAVFAGVDAFDAAGLAAGALLAQNRRKGAGRHAFAALDALALVHVGLAVLPVNGVLGADLHAGMLQAALAGVGDVHHVVGALVAGEFDDVDQGRLIIFFRHHALLDAVGKLGIFGKLAGRHAHGQAQPLAHHGPFHENTVPIRGNFSRYDLKR